MESDFIRDIGVKVDRINERLTEIQSDVASIKAERAAQAEVRAVYVEFMREFGTAAKLNARMASIEARQAAQERATVVKDTASKARWQMIAGLLTIGGGVGAAIVEIIRAISTSAPG